MSSRTILTYAVVILASAALAWGLARKYGDDAHDPRPVSEADDPETDPLWYRGLTTEERVRAARVRLDQMTSTGVAPSETGIIKDEIALLCQDEAVVDVVVETFEERKEMGMAQLSAYMEIFGRIRHEKFGPLLADGLADHRFEPHMNAVEAAIVQRHGALVPFLARQLDLRKGAAAQKILSALAFTGTDDALAVIGKATRSSDRDTAVYAIETVARARLSEVLPDVLRLMESEDPSIAVVASWCVAMLGQSRGRIALENHVKDPRLEAHLRAQAAQCLSILGDRVSVEALRSVVDSDRPDVAFAARSALASMRDEPTVERLVAEAFGDEVEPRRIALQVLGRSGADADVAVVQKRLDELSDDEIAIFIQGLSFGLADAGLGFLSRLAVRRDGLGATSMRVLSKYGNAAIPAFESLLEDAGEDPDRSIAVVAALGGITTREAMEKIHGLTLGSRKARLYARQAVRYIEQKLLSL